MFIDQTSNDLLMFLFHQSGAQLRALLLSKLRPEQFKIESDFNKGFLVKISFIPNGMKIPTKIRYWNVKVVIDKSIGK